MARALVQQFETQRGMRALILDPNGEKWGKHSLVFSFEQEEKFWETVWASKHCVVVCEEASKTIARDDGKAEVFTRIRHNFHQLIVCGHSGKNLTPEMRAQIGTLYLFLQTKGTCKLWAEDLGDDRLYEALTLQRYEFLRRTGPFDPVKKMRLSL